MILCTLQNEAHHRTPALLVCTVARSQEEGEKKTKRTSQERCRVVDDCRTMITRGAMCFSFQRQYIQKLRAVWGIIQRGILTQWETCPIVSSADGIREVWAVKHWKHLDFTVDTAWDWAAAAVYEVKRWTHTEPHTLNIREVRTKYCPLTPARFVHSDC